SFNGVTYLFVLNQSNTTVNGTIQGAFSYGQNGLTVVGEDRVLTSTSSNYSTFQDSFDPYGVHIYAEGPSWISPLAIQASTPEPGTALILGGVATATLLRRRSSACLTVKRDSHPDLTS